MALRKKSSKALKKALALLLLVRIMGYSHKNSRGITYHLHSKGRLYFFSKKEEDSIDLPEDFTVIENQKTGLPMIKRK